MAGVRQTQTPFLQILRAFFDAVGDDDMTPELVEIAHAIVNAWIRGEMARA